MDPAPKPDTEDEVEKIIERVRDVHHRLGAAEPDDPFSEEQPWPEPVVGATLLDDVADTFCRHLSLKEGVADTLTLWAVSTHAIEVSEFAPRLYLTSPTAGCGKSLTLAILTRLCRRPLPDSNITTAAIFRAVHHTQATLLIDEIDTFLKHHRESIGILNSGHYRPMAYVRRLMRGVVVSFSTFGAVALAGIGSLKVAALESRCIILPMRKRGPDEEIEALRVHRGRDRVLRDLGRKAARWTIDHLDRLGEAEPEMPDQLSDRGQDNWRVMIAIADLAGGEWPRRARDAAVNLSAPSEALSTPELLLADIRDIFDRSMSTRIKTSVLVQTLTEMEDREWGSLTQWSVAVMLKPFGIRPVVKKLRGESVASRL